MLFELAPSTPPNPLPPKSYTLHTLSWRQYSFFFLRGLGNWAFPLFTSVLKRTNFNPATNHSWAPTVKIVNDIWPRQLMPDKRHKTAIFDGQSIIDTDNRHVKNQQAAIKKTYKDGRQSTNVRHKRTYRMHILKVILQSTYERVRLSLWTIMQPNLLQTLTRQRRQINLPTNKTYHRQWRSTNSLLNTLCWIVVDSGWF